MDVDAFLGEVADWKAGKGDDTIRPLARRAAAALPGYGVARPQYGRQSTRPIGSFDEAFAEVQRIQAEREADYQRRLAKWEADAPYRERAQRAHEAAMRRYEAEGRGTRRGRMPIAAALPFPFEPPQPPSGVCL